MFWTFCSLFLALLCLGANGSRSLDDLQWLSCTFVDEEVHTNNESYIETKHINRNAVLQFGNVGDKPLHATITFLVTASKMDIRRHLKGNEDKLQCEIRRYSIGKIVTRWPQDHDVWFTCTIHSEGLFVITTFLKHTTVSSAEGRVDFLQWITINDQDLLTTSAVMFILSQTPSVEVGLLKEPRLDCEFGVDHKLPRVTVEWIVQKHGERSKLFSYSSRTKKSEGTGVDVKAIADGKASFKLPATNKHSEGTYICSVMIPPLNGSQAIPLTIIEQPRVSISVDSTLSTVAGELQKIICYAERYYPLDVNIEWYREPPGDSPTPTRLNVTSPSHEHHKDGTYSHSAAFSLKPSMKDSGYKYTCRVSHKSSRFPIQKSFSLIVTDPDSTLRNITAVVFIIAMLVICCYIVPQNLGVRQAVKKFLLLLRSSSSTAYREKWSV